MKFPSSSGFSLLEMLVALGLLATVTLVVVDLWTAAQRLREETKQEISSILIAQRILETVQATRPNGKIAIGLDGINHPHHCITLTRRFHDFRDEEVAKADEARQAKKLDDGCMYPYCPSPSSSLTQHPSGFPASAVERNEIFGLNLQEPSQHYLAYDMAGEPCCEITLEEYEHPFKKDKVSSLACLTLTRTIFPGIMKATIIVATPASFPKRRRHHTKVAILLSAVSCNHEAAQANCTQ